MQKRKVMTSGVLVAGLITAMLAACQPPDDMDDACHSLAKSFQSVPIDLALLGPDYLDNPLPDSVARLEAGYDPTCVVGETGAVLIQCATGDDLQTFTLIHNAPVIWTDAEGFTVMIVSKADHERLQSHDLFWADCHGTSTKPR